MLVPVARMGRRHLPMHNWLGQPERQGQMWRKVLARTHRHTHIIYYYYRCAGLEQRLAGNARGEQRDGDVGDDEPREEERPHGEPAAQVAAQPVHAGGGAALRVPLPLARGEVVGEHLGASVRARDEQTCRVAGQAAADCPRFEGRAAHVDGRVGGALHHATVDRVGHLRLRVGL